jgi:hypothetical protein
MSKRKENHMKNKLPEKLNILDASPDAIMRKFNQLIDYLAEIESTKIIKEHPPVTVNWHGVQSGSTRENPLVDVCVSMSDMESN